MQISSLHRREFLKSLSFFGAAAITAVALPACVAEAGGDADDDSDEETGESEDALVSCSKVNTTIATNHGHTLTVPPADVAAGKAKKYQLSGSHTHTLSLTAADFAKLSSNGKIVILSGSSGGHTHSVTVSCAGTTTTPPTKTCSGKTTIGTNHGHQLAIPQADIVAGKAKKYSIKGTSSHDHTVSLTAADFASLKAKGTLTLTSQTGSGHTHSVTVSCA